MDAERLLTINQGLDGCLKIIAEAISHDWGLSENIMEEVYAMLSGPSQEIVHPKKILPWIYIVYFELLISVGKYLCVVCTAVYNDYK